MGRFNKLYLFLAVVLIIRQYGEVDAARILGMFPLPVRSHFVMSESLMRGLAARGHQVDVVSSFPLKNPPPNYRDISLTGVFPPSINNLTLEDAKKYTGGGIRAILAGGGMRICSALNSPQIRDIIENPPTDPPYDLVINEQCIADCYLAFGRHLNVPMVGIVTSKLYDWMNLPMGNPENAAFVPSIFSAFEQRMSFIERLQNAFLTYFIKFNYWYHNAPSQLSHVEKHFGLKIASISELWNDVAVLLINTHPSFDFVRPLVPGIVEVGGLHVTDGDQDLSPEMKKWLDDSKDGCVYFSFGSMVKIESFPIETVKSFYRAFERIAPIRILMKIAKKDELPEGLPKNVMISPWLPQTRVLQHKNIKLFVTHGGLMSTQEAITYGVPMLGVPIFADQYLNVRLCERKNIMVSVNYQNITAESFTKALNDVLKNSSYRENSKSLSKLFIDRPMSALDTAIFWVEYVLRNGNVLRSPAVELTWWQVELLDVYAVFITLLLIVFFAIKKSVGLVFRLLPSNNVAKISASKSLTTPPQSKKYK